MASACHDHIHVGVAAHVFDVLQVEHGRALHDAYRDCGDMADDRCVLEFALSQKFVHSILSGHKGAGDAGSSSAAVGLNHVTVEVNGSFAEFLQVEHRTQGAANQALDFLGAPTLFAARGLAVAAGVCGARQHAVFGGDPALTAAFFMAWHLFFHRGGTQHLGRTKLDQHRAFGVGGVSTGDAHRA